MARDFTFTELPEEPFLLYPQKNTGNKLVNVADGKVVGFKITGRAFRLHLGNDGKYYQDTVPFAKYFNYAIWDPFACELLEYETADLKKQERIDLRILVGKAGYIKIYENRPVDAREYQRVKTVDNVSSEVTEDCMTVSDETE